MEYNTIYSGTILCPDCQVICGSLVSLEKLIALVLIFCLIFARKIFNVQHKNIIIKNNEMLNQQSIIYAKNMRIMVKHQCQIQSIDCISKYKFYFYYSYLFAIKKIFN